MKNKYLIFDLDRVLFDTDYLNLISKDKYFDSKKNEVFTLKIAKRLDWSKINHKKLLYRGVLDILDDFRKKRFTLILFSEGDKKGQLFKVKISGLAKFFPKEKRFIFTDNKEKKFRKVIAEIDESAEIWLFDDKPSKLKEAKKINDKIKTVLVCRGQWWRTKINGFKPDLRIRSLEKIKENLS